MTKTIRLTPCRGLLSFPATQMKPVSQLNACCHFCPSRRLTSAPPCHVQIKKIAAVLAIIIARPHGHGLPRKEGIRPDQQRRYRDGRRADDQDRQCRRKSSRTYKLELEYKDEAGATKTALVKISRTCMNAWMPAPILRIKYLKADPSKMIIGLPRLQHWRHDGRTLRLAVGNRRHMVLLSGPADPAMRNDAARRMQALRITKSQLTALLVFCFGTLCCGRLGVYRRWRQEWLRFFTFVLVSRAGSQPIIFWRASSPCCDQERAQTGGSRLGGLLAPQLFVWFHAMRGFLHYSGWF